MLVIVSAISQIGKKGLPLIVVIIFLGKISRPSQDVGGWKAQWCHCVFFADDVVLLTSSRDGLQLALEHFAFECEADGMGISTSKSDCIVLMWKKVECP